MKRVMMIAVFALLSVCDFAQTVGEKVYKEVSVNGEMVSKWLEVASITEYDNKGNEIHSKNSDGFEEWYEYDSSGNKIHYKDTYGVEKWYEYDSKGNEIHSKESNGDEYWYEYDSSGNKIHSKESNGFLGVALKEAA